MRKFLFLMTLIVVIGVCRKSIAMCGCLHLVQVQGEKSGPAVKEVGNKFCPVSGEEIKEEEAVKVEYEGKIYNLCCKMCVEEFKKDPEKYIKKLEEIEEKTNEEHHPAGHAGCAKEKK